MLGVRLRQEIVVACANCPLSSMQSGRETCEKAGPIRAWDPAFECPENRFDVMIELMHKPKGAGVVVGANWSEAVAWVKKVKAAVGSFTDALLSGKATDDKIAQRKASCAACPDRLDKDGRSYCNNPAGCGCPQSKFWPFSELDEKLTWAKLNCPLKQKGFSNEA